MPSLASTNAAPLSATPFLGLAPFLRRSIAGENLLPLAQQMLADAGNAPEDANLWMNLSIALQCLGQRDLGLAIQQQALAVQRTYHLAAARQPARLRLLLLMAAGDLAENTPLECLLEDSDIDLVFSYLDPAAPLALTVPEHDALVVALSDSDANQGLLAALEEALADWPRPVINRPQHIPATERSIASRLLQQVPGLLMPPTWRAPRTLLEEVGAGRVGLGECFADCDFPVILRPVGSQAGRDLDKIESPEDIAGYLSRVPAEEAEFFVSPFIDYRSADGQFRKIRVALIGGRAFACHMAVSSHWMVHYVNAGMYQDAGKRAEEAQFMAHFDAFAQRHRVALETIQRRTGLDYLCVDCAETPDGQLLVFEADHVMVVHAMDPEALFPYKQPYMQQVKNGFRDFVLGLGVDRSIPA